MNDYIYLLVPHWVEVWDDKLHALVEKYDSPYIGSIIFVIIIVIMFTAIRNSNK